MKQIIANLSLNSLVARLHLPFKLIYTLIKALDRVFPSTTPKREIDVRKVEI